MENLEHQNSAEQLKQLANGWHNGYEKALDDFFNEENPDRQKLVDILWEHGIVNRVSPQDAEEKKHAKN